MAHEYTVRPYFKMSLDVVNMYQWLLDLYVLDFFVDDHWMKLPSSWRESFSDIDPLTLGNIISGQPMNIVMPLSFITLLKCVECLSIPRQSRSMTKRDMTSVPHTDSCAGHPRLKNLFLKHVKIKKRHEITQMAEVVKDVADQTSCNAVLDFGSGVGHLVRVLAYKYGLYAVGIESQSQLTEEARKHDVELEYTASKHLSEKAMAELHRPIHVNMMLKHHQQLHQIALPQGTDSYGLVGLHPCGDLGPLLLKCFVTSKNLKFICLVGCCYMKLTGCGYPMSMYAKTVDSDLSYASREIACHAIEVYCDRLRKGEYEDLKIHAYRAALERILVGMDPKLKHAPVRSIKHSDTMTFEGYCTLALERLDIPLPLEPEVWSRGKKDLEQWRRVVIVYTLRLALAPLVETVILLDRMLYVLEHGLSCDIRPVFDAKLSPRNHIMIARRFDK